MKIKNRYKYNKSRRLIGLIVIFCPILFLFLTILKWPVYNYLLNNYSIKTVANIINEKNFKGKGIITEMYTYSYEFSVNGKSYKGDSSVKDIVIGTKLKIEYVIFCPTINRSLKK